MTSWLTLAGDQLAILERSTPDLAFNSLKTRGTRKEVRSEYALVHTCGKNRNLSERVGTICGHLGNLNVGKIGTCRHRNPNERRMVLTRLYTVARSIAHGGENMTGRMIERTVEGRLQPHAIHAGRGTRTSSRA